MFERDWIFSKWNLQARNEEEKKIVLVADDDDDEDEEEELVDPMEALREQCSKDAHSLALLDELAKCTERVESRTMTEETCTQVNWLFQISYWQ